MRAMRLQLLQPAADDGLFGVAGVESAAAVLGEEEVAGQPTLAGPAHVVIDHRPMTASKLGVGSKADPGTVTSGMFRTSQTCR